MEMMADRNGNITKYIYDAGGNMLAEADDLNNITRYYIHGLGLMAMVTDTDQVYTYHFNAIGSTIAMTDPGQNIVNMYAYTPFGILANESESIPQPFKFVGQYGVMTEPNGLYYMRARYYDPEVGRFISEDPIGFGGGINLYLYAANNPLLLIDPLGLRETSNNARFESAFSVSIPNDRLSSRDYNFTFENHFVESIYTGMDETRTIGQLLGLSAGGGFAGLSGETGTTRSWNFGLGSHLGASITFINGRFDGASVSLGLAVASPVSATVPECDCGVWGALNQ
jgi:RHS repeat-associated protein